MAEFASKGVAGTGLGLGIAGTALGLLNNGFGNGLFGLRQANTYEQEMACQHDLNCLKEMMSKDAEIARLNAKNYSDESDIAVYKYINSEINNIKDRIYSNEKDQAVINATVNTGLATLGSQIASVSATVANITKTAVPTSAICNFGCGCNTCATI